MATELQLNRELIQDLRDSRKDGELYPVIDGRFPDGHEERISGNHRSAAGWKKRESVPVKNRFEFLKLKLAATVQRKSSFEEQAGMIREICEYFSKDVGMPKEKIANHLRKNIHGITQSYLYEMIPDEYKKGRSSGESAKLKAAAMLQTVPNLESESAKPFSPALPPSNRLVPRTTTTTPDRILKLMCPHCPVPLYVNVTKQEAFHKE
jgi:hypothetical protein